MLKVAENEMTYNFMYNQCFSWHSIYAEVSRILMILFRSLCVLIGDDIGQSVVSVRMV